MAPLRIISEKIFLSSILSKTVRIHCRLVSTTGKKEESDKNCDTKQAIYKKIPDFSKPLENKNWVSYGFDFEDQDKDKYSFHTFCFGLITVFLCGMTFVYMYMPDKEKSDWARREAFIRLHEREQLGLDPVDKNYIDPSKIVLPPDEELSEKDIVI